MPVARRRAIRRKHDPLHLLLGPEKQPKVILGLDLGTAYSNVALMVLDTTKPIPSPSSLLQQDVWTHAQDGFIRVLRGFPNTSGQWEGMPTGNVPSEVWFHAEGLKGPWNEQYWGWRARNGFKKFGGKGLECYFDSFKAKLNPRVWDGDDDLAASERQSVELQVYYFLICLYKHTSTYYAAKESFVHLERLSAISITVPSCWTCETKELFTSVVYRVIRDVQFVRQGHAILDVRPIVVNEAEAVAESYLA